MARIVTGERPTGPLHLGHYFGSLAERVRLQKQGHLLYLVIADYQVITDRDRAGDLPDRVLGLVLDYLAAGLDPDDTVVFRHSAVPAIHELAVAFLSLVSVGELRRNPTVNDEIAHSRQRSVNGLMFTYPVHQAADVLALRGELVPVGADQLPHLELMRTVARRFAERYERVFPIPEPVLSHTPRLPGLDGGKMSKSRQNAIALTATADEITAMIRRARTDSIREITFDPVSRPDVARLLELGALVTGTDPTEFAARIDGAGAARLKAYVTEAVDAFVEPMRRRRAEFTAADAAAILSRGNERAAAEASATLHEAHRAMGMAYDGAPAAPRRCRMIPSVASGAQARRSQGGGGVR
jgi:tryptophanyl-tRNA synthetase